MIMIVGLDVWFREQRGFVSKKLEFFPNESIISNRILQTIIIEIFPIISHCSRMCVMLCKRDVIKVEEGEGEKCIN